MGKAADVGPAPFEMLASGLGDAIGLVAIAMREWETAYGHRLGKAVPRSPLREEIIWITIQAINDGAPCRMGDLARKLRRYGTAPTVRAEVEAMERGGLLARVPDPNDGRTILAIPSRRLVNFLNEFTPKYLEKMAKAYRALVPEV